MRNTRRALLRQLTRGENVTQILSPICLDDYRGLDREILIGLPQEELLAVALEQDFDELRQKRGRRK